MVLAQAVLQIFCWQDCFTIQDAKVKKGTQFSQLCIEFCQKLIRQVIYTLDTICMPKIMILAQVLLLIFCWQGSIDLQWVSQRRGITLPQQVWLRKKYRSCLFFMLVLYIEFQDPIYNSSWPFAMDGQPDGQMDGQAQTNMRPQVLQSWGHNNSFPTIYGNLSTHFNHKK